MIELHTYLLFIGAVVILVIVPGPDMAYMLTRTIAQGRRAGLVAVVGINVGAYVHVAAVVLGLTAILAASSVAFTVMKVIGACYLIWLGVQAIRSKAGPIDVAGGKALRLDDKVIFWQGFLSDVLNPKVAIFFLAFLPQFVNPHNPAMSVTQQLLVLGVTSNVVAICLNMLIVCFASIATAGIRKNQKLVAWLNKAAGAVFVGLGVRIASERL